MAIGIEEDDVVACLSLVEVAATILDKVAEVGRVAKTKVLFGDW